MPLPSVVKHGAKLCTAKSKRTRLPCKNPAAYGCKTCRFHGARQQKTILQGDSHPNYIHGSRTLEAQRQFSKLCLELQQLENTMHALGLTVAQKSKGRKAKGYKNS